MHELTLEVQVHESKNCIIFHTVHPCMGYGIWKEIQHSNLSATSPLSLQTRLQNVYFWGNWSESIAIPRNSSVSANCTLLPINEETPVLETPFLESSLPAWVFVAAGVGVVIVLLLLFLGLCMCVVLMRNCQRKRKALQLLKVNHQARCDQASLSLRVCRDVS